MINGVGRVLYESIIDNKWVDIEYENKDGNTHFWIAIIRVKKNEDKILDCKMVNYKKNYKESKDTQIDANKILSARIINGSYFKCDNKFKEKLLNFPQKYTWLEMEQFNDNILRYLVEANMFDNDPYILEDDCRSIKGLRFDDFYNKKSNKLSQETMDELVDLIMKVNKRIEDKENLRYAEICLSSLSIAIKDKKYVIAYRRVYVDFDEKVAVLDDNSSINNSFLIDGKKVNLFNYLQCDPKVFQEEYDNASSFFMEEIRKNLSSYEKIDTKEEIFILKRNYSADMNKVVNSIIEMNTNNNLTKPITAYFGNNNTKRKAKNKEPYIVIRDGFANPDQIRVVYNTMTNYITYVEGPPGTGKTKTIINVILSAMANNQNCLVCSNNNKPINDIYESISFKHSNGDNVLFPIIRVGNEDVNIEAMTKIEELYLKALEIKKRKLNDELTEKSKKKGLSIFENLKAELDNYEKKQELIENRKNLNKVKQILDPAFNNINLVQNEIEKINSELLEYDHINENSVKKLVIPADENEDYKNYLYYKSMAFIKKLADPSYEELIDIVKMSDKKKANELFVKYLSDDEKLKKFTSVFPIVLCTNISSNKLGSANPHFDLCIMDEAGQCNIATSLIPIVRAKSLLLVGDINQLKPVIVLEDNLNKKLMEKYNISKEYNYMENSILNLMKTKDKNSKYILLRYHYRCPKKIIDFCNRLFYDDQLKIENDKEANFKFINVENNNNAEINNCYKAEAQAIIDLIKANNYDNATIITPFKNQAELLNQMLKENNIENINAGTIHTMQGAEKNTIILSMALSRKTGDKTFEWVKNNEQLINVGVSRAKRDVIMVGDYEVLKKMDKGENSIIVQLADYVRSNGDVSTVKPEVNKRKNLSNDSKAEEEMYETLVPLFEKHKNLKIEKNIKVCELLQIPEKELLNYYYKAEFDFVIFSLDVFNNKKVKLIVELDGGEHISCEKTFKNDRKKEILCNREKFKILRIPNSLSKDYVYLIEVLCEILNIEKPKTQHD